MEESPDAWSAYGRLQETLRRRRRVDDYTWGLEAGLNRMLDGAGSPEDLERAVRSGARKHRNRAALLVAVAIGEAETTTVDPSDALDTHDALSHIRCNVGDADWVLLRALGEGYEYKEIARVLNVSPGALRARTLRLRRALRPAVADSLMALAS